MTSICWMDAWMEGWTDGWFNKMKSELQICHGVLHSQIVMNCFSRRLNVFGKMVYGKLVRYISISQFLSVLTSWLYQEPKFTLSTQDSVISGSNSVKRNKILHFFYNHGDGFLKSPWNWFLSLSYSPHLLAAWKRGLETKTFPSFVASGSEEKLGLS